MELSNLIPLSSDFFHSTKQRKADPPATSFSSSLVQDLKRLIPVAEHPSHSFPSSFTPTRDTRNPSEPIEHLSWSGKRLVWAKGASVWRTFSFDEQAQDVNQALFAWFSVPGQSSTSAQQSSSQPPVPSTSAARLDNPTFGPFRPTPPVPWTDDPLPLPSEPTTSRTTPSHTLQRHLVVFLTDIAIAYPPSGGMIPFQLPFQVRRAWAMNKGLIIQRAEGGREIFSQSSTELPHLPTLYSLLDPVDEMKVVSVTPSLKGIFNPTSSNPPTASEPTFPFQDHKEKIIFTSDCRDGSEPIFVSVSAAKSTVTVWSYATISHGLDGVDTGGLGGAQRGEDNEAKLGRRKSTGGVKGKGKGKERATGGGARDTRAATTAATGKRKRSSFPPNASQAPTSLGDRRRTSGGGNVGSMSVTLGEMRSTAAGAHAEEADLLEALGESMRGTTMKRTTSAMSSGMTGHDRRGSITRNELSITMDRMALGMGGGVAQAGGNGEMDREATLFVSDLEEHSNAASDVYVESLLTISISDISSSAFSSIALKDASACLFNSCSSSSRLAICLPTSQRLFTLRLSRKEDSRIEISPPTLHRAIAMTPVIAHRDHVLDLLLLDSESQWHLLTNSDILETISGPPATKVAHLVGDGSRRFIGILEDGTRVTSTTSPPLDGLTNRCLNAISLALTRDDFALFRSTFAEQRKAKGSRGTAALEGALATIFNEALLRDPTTTLTDTWSQFVRVSASIVDQDPLFANFHPISIAPPIIPVPMSTPDSDTRQRLDHILLALHLLAEDAKLDVDRAADYHELVKIILPLVSTLGLRSWADYYIRASGCSSYDLPPDVNSELFPLASQPPSLLAHLRAILEGRCPAPESCFTSPSVSHFFGRWLPSKFYGDIRPTRTTHQLIHLYSLLAKHAPNAGPLTSPTSRAQSCVLALHDIRWDLERIKRLRFAVSLPLREAIRLCQFDAPESWPAAAYELIRRPDLSKQAGWSVKPVSVHKIIAPSHPPAIDKIPTNGTPLVYEDQVKTVETIAPPAARFNEDRRVEEVGRILQYSEPVTITAGNRSIDQLTPQVQQSILNALSHRTLALPVGFAMFKYHSKARNQTESVAIARINTTARILPMPSPVTLIDKEPRDAPGVGYNDRIEWPDFHSGVAAALQLHAGNAHFDSAQISFNKPTDLDARHAGLLLGLGLTGHIGAMVFNQAFDYLKAKHDPTSIGLLLGLAVTYLGTGDPKVTSLLSVHLAALHPPNSSHINVSGITQAAGLVGIGLLYLGSGRRTLADVMVCELCAIKVTNIEEPSACREAYALSAGFAFGMIMLGKGTSASTTADEVDLLTTFRALTLGESNHPLPGSLPSFTATDVNITSPAATIALGLMYLKTERQDVADILEIPDTSRRLDYVRSDLLLLRTLSRSLIMWNTVASTKAWVESHVPQFITDKLGPSGTSKGLDADLDIARWNIIAGACFGMGLRFAGSAAVEPHSTLIHYLDRLTRAAYVKASTVQGKIKRHAIRCCLSVVATALALVMAGTGEINVMRRLRVAHGHFSEGVTYGTHLASHMALGMLFVGAGHYSLGTSNTAIAALLLAFYPSYPTTSIENRAHLQAYRHLWTLAVEPRCLEVRDVDTNEAAFLPVRLKLFEKQALVAKSLVAPTLIPELRLIDSIQIDSPRYWAFTLRLAANSEHLDSFLRDATIYVKRKTGHLSYGQDPRGIRSIFTRSKSETGSSVFDFGEMARLLAPSVSGLREFVSAFLEDPESKAAVASLCQPSTSKGLPTAFEAFSASVLLECLTRDKRDLIVVYLAIYSAWSELDRKTINSRDALLDLEQLEFMIDFYRRGAYKTLFTRHRTRSSTAPALREPLIQSAFVDHIALKVSALSDSLLSSNPNLRSALSSYLKNSTWPQDPTVGIALSAWLAIKAVPNLSIMEELRVVCKEDGPGGNEQVQTLLLTDMSSAMEESGGKAWSRTFSELAVELWSQ